MGAAAKLKVPLTRKTIMVSANKGGTGKTTTAINLAVAASYRGWDVACIDLDVQHSFNRWRDRRARIAGIPQIASYAGRLEHYRHLLDQTRSHEIVFIDTPPGVSENIVAMKEMIEMADLVLVPCMDSILDVETTIPWVTAIKGTKANKVAFVLNRINSRSSEGRDTQGALITAGRVCGIEIRNSVNIRRYFKTGRSVVDAPGNSEKSKQDFVDIWNWIEQETGIANG